LIFLHSQKKTGRRLASILATKGVPDSPVRRYSFPV
jgi:hypothetical protein